MSDDTLDFHVLLIEDSPADIELTAEAFASSGRAVHLHVVRDGAAAIAFLRREGEYSECPRPDLILLDLNLPDCSGHDVLRQCKEDIDLRLIPVAVLSTSRAPHHIRDAYALHANCYVPKPVDVDEFFALIRNVLSLWPASDAVVTGQPNEARAHRSRWATPGHVESRYCTAYGDATGTHALAV